jgi:hypothetical protein
MIGARAYDEKEEAALAFGFDTIGAGMLPVHLSGLLSALLPEQMWALQQVKGLQWVELSVL